jgi:isopenicillin N synthase-like dioxygenase
MATAPDPIPIVDLSAYFAGNDAEQREQAAKDFTDACYRLGFVTIVGHGVSPERLAEAFAWSKKLFDLSHEDKMKAPHPPTNTPHRGYSAPGLEKVYSKEERMKEEAQKTGGKSMEKIKDYKVDAVRPLVRTCSKNSRKATRSAARKTPASPTSGYRKTSSPASESSCPSSTGSSPACPECSSGSSATAWA